MLTVEEAKKKWCPMGIRAGLSRTISGSDVVSTAGYSFNRTAKGAGSPTCLCLADGCMAWREGGYSVCRKCNGKKWDSGTGAWQTDCDHPWEKVGFCGLAGGVPNAD